MVIIYLIPLSDKYNKIKIMLFAVVEWLKPLPGRIDQVQFKWNKNTEFKVINCIYVFLDNKIDKIDFDDSTIATIWSSPQI